MSNTSSLLDVAVEYHELGFSVIPLRGKQPVVRWREYQSRRANCPEIENLFQESGVSGVGIVTGAISNLVVLDADVKDRQDGKASLFSLNTTALTPLAVTGSGGYHQFFKHPACKIKNRTGLLPGLDVRADGGYVVAPPSLHPNGSYYSWKTPPSFIAPAPLSDAVLALLLADPRPVSTGGMIPKNTRNTTLFAEARSLLASGVVDKPKELLDTLLKINAIRCVPPLPEDEVSRLAQHAFTLEHEPDFAGFQGPEVTEARNTISMWKRLADKWSFGDTAPDSYGILRTPRIAETRRRVYMALCNIAYRVGKLTFAVSIREVAERVGCSLMAAQDAMSWLRGAGYLPRHRGYLRGTEAPAQYTISRPVASRLTAGMLAGFTLGGLIQTKTDRSRTYSVGEGNDQKRTVAVHTRSEGLTTPDSQKRTVAVTLRTVAVQSKPLVVRGGGVVPDVWSSGGLGHRVKKLYELLDLELPMAPKDISLAVGVGTHQTRKLLVRMKGFDMVQRIAGGWIKRPADLEALAVRLGVAGTGERRREQHRQQRKTFREQIGL